MLCSINRICIYKHLGIPAILTAHLRPRCTVNAGLPVLLSLNPKVPHCTACPCTQPCPTALSVPAPSSAPLHCLSLHPAVHHCSVCPCTQQCTTALSVPAPSCSRLHCKSKRLSHYAARARTFKSLWGPRIDSMEWIPPVYAPWRDGTRTLFLLGA